MDIIRTRQEKRRNQIADITESIKNSLAKDKGLNKKDILMAVMANIGLSRRTSQEYIDVALYQLGVELQ